MKKLLLVLSIAAVLSLPAHAACANAKIINLASFANPGQIVIPAVTGCSAFITDIHATAVNQNVGGNGGTAFIGAYEGGCGTVLVYATTVAVLPGVQQSATFQLPVGNTVKIGLAQAGCVMSSFALAGFQQSLSIRVSYQ